MDFSRSNRFTINARNLDIAEFDNPNHWTWLPIREINSEVANLKTIYSLDVNGKFNTTNLPLVRFYEVVFVIKLEEDTAHGWETPVNLKLTISGVSTETKERSVSLKEHIGKGWVDISAGEFITAAVNLGEISFSLYQRDSRISKGGLSLKGVIIRPAYQQNNSEMDFERGNPFLMNARQLGITWSENPNYWTWLSMGETDPEVASLKAVCWLDVNGTFNTKNLSLSTLYEVVFVVKLEETASGWETPVNLKLITKPENIKIIEEKSLSLKEHIGKGWVDISAGEFTATAANGGEISFSLFERESNWWKKGLLVKGVAIRPKI